MTTTTAFTLISIAVFLKLLATTTVQALARRKANAYARPEDAAHWQGTVDDPPAAALAQLALRNDGENIPVFLALAAAFGAIGGHPLALLGYGVVFIAARSLHTHAYVRPRQPLRNRAYVAGLAVTFAIAVHAGVLVVSDFVAISGTD